MEVRRERIDVNQRVAYANDPYVLLAVVDQANQDKRDYVVDERRPSNTPYQCDYVARQIGIKNKYKLTVTGTEHDAMNLMLAICLAQVGAPYVPVPALETYACVGPRSAAQRAVQHLIKSPVLSGGRDQLQRRGQTVCLQAKQDR